MIAAGIVWAIAFIVIGLGYQLQMYGDGSIFSYAIAVEDVWAFHWHNISGRVFVYLFSLLPAEIYVGLTRDPHGGIVAYGVLFFSAPLLGLIATFAADRSPGRIFFSCACFSTACLCPLVFGFPTETWVAHSLFWPALAMCHYAPRRIAGALAIFAMMLALVLSYEGAMVLAVAIVLTLLLRGSRDAAFVRAAAVFIAVVPVWIAVKLLLPPDDYFASVLQRAALHVLDVKLLTDGLVLLLLGSLAAFGVLFLVLRRFVPATAHVYAAAIVTVILTVYWLWFDRALHAEGRYYLRTAILLGTPALGMLAALRALGLEGELRPSIRFLQRLEPLFASRAARELVLGVLLVTMLVHTVETVKFARAWAGYKAAVGKLAMSSLSDPALGDALFVSANRIEADPRLAWPSTTHFLSALVAPGFAPARLVVDPAGYYFWLTCATAEANERAERMVPAATRRLIRLHACLHR